MDETFNIKAIIINRRNFREHDARLQVFSFEAGKLDLVVRGAKKIGSKIAPFVEPITLTKLMIIRGKRYDYVGGADAIKNYNSIKTDLEKTLAAGRILLLYNKFIREKSKDESLYGLLKNALDIIEAGADLDFFIDIFTIKFFNFLGYGFELFDCMACHQKLLKTDKMLDFIKGGIICESCFQKNEIKNTASLTISTESIIILRLINEKEIARLVKIKTKLSNKNEIKSVSRSLIKFYSS
jgi:DNA repair protein RecO (recombination protein O)